MKEIILISLALITAGCTKQKKNVPHNDMEYFINHPHEVMHDSYKKMSGPDWYNEAAISLGFQEKHACGLWQNTNSITMKALTEWAIPDYFPVDEPVAKALLMATNTIPVKAMLASEACLPHAEFYPACRKHDFCSEHHLKNGSECDTDLLSNWNKACEVYDVTPCETLCKQVAQSAWDILVALHPLEGVRGEIED